MLPKCKSQTLNSAPECISLGHRWSRFNLISKLWEKKQARSWFYATTKATPSRSTEWASHQSTTTDYLTVRHGFLHPTIRLVNGTKIFFLWRSETHFAQIFLEETESLKANLSWEWDSTSNNLTNWTFKLITWDTKHAMDLMTKNSTVSNVFFLSDE